jgi:hypothetical protein
VDISQKTQIVDDTTHRPYRD